MAHANTLDVDSIIERLLSVRGQPNNRTVQLAEGEIRALCASARGTVELEFCIFTPSGKSTLLTIILGSVNTTCEWKLVWKMILSNVWNCNECVMGGRLAAF